MLLDYLVELNESQTPFTVKWTMGETPECVSEVNEITDFYQVLIRTPTQYVIPLINLMSITFTIDGVTTTVFKDGTVSIDEKSA